MALPSKLLFIADVNELGEKIFPVLNAALAGGCRWILLRGLKTHDKAALQCALKTKALCEKYKAAFFIAHELPIARRVKADGLHLSAKQDARKYKTKGVRLGQSCHNEKEIKRAISAGVDYIFLSPIFLTKSKPGYGPAIGLRKLKSLAAKTTLPIVALGGITPQNTAACLKAGAKAVAVMGGMGRARDPKKKTKNYLKNLINQ